MDWSRVGEVVLLTAGMYLVLMVATRVAGRRTLAQLSAFDILTTIALGTILGSTAISPSIGAAEGTAAVGTLLALQLSIGALRRRFTWVRRWTDFRPVRVAKDGTLSLPSGILGPQLTAEEVRSQVRLRGIFDDGDLAEAVLEPTGRISAQRSAPAQPPDAAAERTTRDVLEDHLARSRTGDVSGDLRHNYHPAVVLLWAGGLERGDEALSRLAGGLHAAVPGGSHEHRDLQVADEVGVLTWSARDEDRRVHDGADTFVVRDGRIVAQTTHCSVCR